MADKHPATRPTTDRWLDPANLQHAVLAVYRTNGQRTEPPKQAAEDWTLSTGYRRDLWLRSSWHWQRQTNIASHLFPLSEDAVCRLYMHYRKKGGDKESAQPELFDSERK